MMASRQNNDTKLGTAARDSDGDDDDEEGQPLKQQQGGGGGWGESRAASPVPRRLPRGKTLGLVSAAIVLLVLVVRTLEDASFTAGSLEPWSEEINVNADNDEESSGNEALLREHDTELAPSDDIPTKKMSQQKANAAPRKEQHGNAPSASLKSREQSTMSPSVFFEEGSLWEPLSKDNPEIISDQGDWKWVFPNISREEFMNTRFLPDEVSERCNGECCIGASGNGGGSVRPDKTCAAHMDFMAEFQRLTHRKRALYSIVDLIELYRRQKGPDTSPRIFFIGDSVTGQYHAALMCEAVRNERVNRVEFRFDEDTIKEPDTHWTQKIVFREATVWLKGDAPNRNTSIIYVRNYRVRANSDMLKMIFEEADILIIGWGLHYNHGEEKTFGKALDHAFAALEATPNAQDILLIWLGSNKQHFRYSDEDEVSDGTYHSPLKPKIQWCGPTLRYPIGHPLHDFRNVYAFKKTSHTKGSLIPSWINWRTYEENCEQIKKLSQRGKVMHFIPHFALTAPFYRNHDTYGTNRTIWQNDCTHTCWAPNLLEPFWDAIYLALNTRSCEREMPKQDPVGNWSPAFLNVSRAGGRRVYSMPKMKHTLQHHLNSKIMRYLNESLD